MGRSESGEQTKWKQDPQFGIRPGNPHLKAVLAEVVWAISHTKDKYLSAHYHRIARRRGKQKALVAVSHSVLVILYHVLRDKKPYSDLGAAYFDKLVNLEFHGSWPDLGQRIIEEFIQLTL